MAEARSASDEANPRPARCMAEPEVAEARELGGAVEACCDGVEALQQQPSVKTRVPRTRPTGSSIVGQRWRPTTWSSLQQKKRRRWWPACSSEEEAFWC